MKLTLKILILVLVLSTTSSAQKNFNEEIKFYNYLLDKNLDKEAIYLLSLLQKYTLTKSQTDSLNYELGWFFYTKKKLDSSTSYLTKVTKDDLRYTKSLFFAGSNLVIQKKIVNALDVFNKIDTSDENHNELLKYQKAGIALLKRDLIQYDSISSSTTFSKYYLEQEAVKLNALRQKIASTKRKSPFLAGTLSAIIPGAGKWYAGKKKQAIGSFIPICALAFLTKELYNKTDIKKDLRFWLFSSFFTTFYVGNIIGSVELAKTINKTSNENYDNQIIFNLHIPIRNFFN